MQAATTFLSGFLAFPRVAGLATLLSGWVIAAGTAHTSMYTVATMLDLGYEKQNGNLGNILCSGHAEVCSDARTGVSSVREG